MEFSSETISETPDSVIEEVIENPENTEEQEQPVAKQEVQPLPEITPTEAPPPMFVKEEEKQEVVVEAQSPVQGEPAVTRHPRNIPKFSRVRG